MAIFGDGPDEDIACDGPRCNLQLEGTGRRPKDVVIDGRFEVDVVLRGIAPTACTSGNFTIQRAREHALYVIETDGFAIDRMGARWNGLYGFLNFMTDHGLYHRCEAYGNGDGGVYPGSQQT